MQIGPYQIIGRIGSGGMATVYKAYHPRLDRHVALKLMHDSFIQEHDFLARFEREARIVARLDHPNIIPIYDYDKHEGKPYLVMKVVEGDTLKEVLERGELAATGIVSLTRKIADALHYAHEQGILHRDIKPSNIMLDQRGEPYLTDFGLARILQSGESTMSADVMLGTPHYISPEQAQGGMELDARTDVYSLGVVLYQIVTGRVPFTGDSSFAIIHDHIYSPPPSPRSINPEVPPAVESVLLKALAKRPNDRYATPVALVQAYEQALAGHAEPAPPITPTEIGDEIRRSIQDAKDRFSWKSGAKWAQNAQGQWGFFTHDDLDAAEASLDEATRIRRRVERRLKARQEFYGHLISWVTVIAFLWIIWAFTGGGHLWPLYPMFGWGIGIGFHWLDYYQNHGGGRERREAMIDREVARERQRKAKNEEVFSPGSVRLSQDGEFTESYVEDLKRKNQ